MATTLSKGYIKPANPDTGDIFFPAMATNAQLVNDHTHNGTLGALNTNNVQTIAAGSWVATSGGTYRQLITLPSGSGYAFDFDSCMIEFRLSTGQMVYPTVEKVSSTTYYVYTNDNSLIYKACYR